jgi:ATP-dependent phosphoenolpyruvate carboxykinase
MWEELVSQRGGLPLTRIPDAPGADLEDCEFVAVLVEDREILPAVASLGPAQAAAFLLLSGEGADPEDANALLAELAEEGRPAYLLKAGRVGGSDPEVSIGITEAHARTILDAIRKRRIEWEEDPDFGYRVAAALPGIEGRDRFLLIPRFLYARTDRVYHYAALVPAVKRHRAERLSSLSGLDPAIVDAVR